MAIFGASVLIRPYWGGWGIQRWWQGGEGCKGKWFGTGDDINMWSDLIISHGTRHDH